MTEIGDVKKFVPHRSPFLFVDRLLALEAGSRGVGIKTYPADDIIFQGSATDPPSVPAGILIESMAQVSAAVSLGVGKKSGQNRTPQPGYLVAINQFEYLTPVLAGCNTTITAEITFSFGLMLKSQCSISIHNKVVATAELSFMLIENPASA